MKVLGWIFSRLLMCRWMIAMTLFGVGIAVVASGEFQHTSDSALRVLWAQKKLVFGELLDMVKQDNRIVSLTSRSIIWDDGQASGDIAGYTKYRDFDRNRWDHYRELLTAVGCRDGIYVHRNDGLIVFSESAYGAFLAGSSKGVAFQFSANLPPWVKAVDTLDAKTAPRAGGKYVCLLEGHWFIYFDRTG